MPDDDPWQEECAGILNKLSAWSSEPVPWAYFRRFRPKLGGSPTVASPLDVLRCAIFWRSLPYRTFKSRQKAKEAEHEAFEFATTIPDLLRGHRAALDVLVFAAEAEGLDSSSIIESNRLSERVLIESPECVGAGLWLCLWPECLGDLGREKLRREWPILMKAERVLKRLEARMHMRQRGGQMPGGAAMRVPVTPDEAAPKARRARAPSDRQKKIAQYYEQSGKTQQEVADMINKKRALGKDASLVTQTGVSRAVKAENKYRRASGNLPQIKTGKVRKAPPVSPTVMEMGTRMDGRAKSQRPTAKP